MKLYKSVGIATTLVIFICLLVNIIPGLKSLAVVGFQVLGTIVNGVITILEFTLILFGAGVLGYFIRNTVIEWLDERNEPDENISTGWHFIYAILGSIVLACFWVFVYQLLLYLPTYFLSIMQSFHWTGPFTFETLTDLIGWAIIGATTFFMGYFWRPFWKNTGF